MKNIQAIGSGFIILGFLFLVGYSLWILIASEEIPYFIRAGTAIAVIGIIIVLIALVRERLNEEKV